MHSNIENLGEVKVTLALVAAGYLSAEDAFPILVGKVAIRRNPLHADINMAISRADLKDPAALEKKQVEFDARQALTRLAAKGADIQRILDGIVVL